MIWCLLFVKEVVTMSRVKKPGNKFMNTTKYDSSVTILVLLLFLLLTGSHNLLNYAIICLIDK